jgi:hypothetical protein
MMKHTEFLELKPKLVELLRTASYHYADDSGKEWGAAARAMDEFIELAVEKELTYYHYEDVYTAATPLMPFSAIVDGVLRYLKRNMK